ncbi:unnamed protein product [Angiostrongylus costaricensis]|uniref:Uncharacterized protein n=1 Tax=Angiostrongylus costaricensis TaxID=334426 RepID=A0A0R3PGJ7_ANGCS|nr:unnamed protein product [Angiostrongylus costaricensis]
MLDGGLLNGNEEPKRVKAPISLRFNSIRLNDLSDDYGFGDDLDLSVVDDDVVVEEALEANNLQIAAGANQM